MTFNRRQILAGSGALAAASLPLGVAAQADAAANFPNKPIRIVVPFQAGGATDALARVLGQSMAADLGQPVVVENKPGAAGIIGTNDVAKAAPDGYTISLGLSTNLLLNKFLYTKMPFDPVRDLAMLYRLMDAGAILVVNAAMPVKTLADLRKHIEANRGKLSYGSYGQGSYPHLAGERINQITKGGMAHAAYKGETPMIQALLSREIDIGWGSAQAIRQFVEGGKLRALAYTGSTPPVGMPGVPTFAEGGMPDDAFTLPGWFGTAVPAKTPEAIKQKLAGAIAKALAKPEVKERVAAMGFVPLLDSTPEKFTAEYMRDLPKWEALVKTVGVKLD
jgi:tripartite-type tricarboxylate transporter receptor subunit TctC